MHWGGLQERPGLLKTRISEEGFSQYDDVRRRALLRPRKSNIMSSDLCGMRCVGFQHLKVLAGLGLPGSAQGRTFPKTVESWQLLCFLRHWVPLRSCPQALGRAPLYSAQAVVSPRAVVLRCDVMLLALQDCKSWANMARERTGIASKDRETGCVFACVCLFVCLSFCLTLSLSLCLFSVYMCVPERPGEVFEQMLTQHQNASR